MFKRGIRILGVDDAPFKKNTREVLVVGVVWRDGIFEGVLSTHVERDGSDSTARILRMILSSRFASQIKIIMLHGIMLAGFNVVDIKKLHRRTGIPVIGVTRRKPDATRVLAALKKVKGFAAKLKLVEAAGPSFPVDDFYAQLAGVSVTDAKSILKKYGIAPLRAAHIIASGIVSGESSGRI